MLVRFFKGFGGPGKGFKNSGRMVGKVLPSGASNGLDGAELQKNNTLNDQKS